MIGEAKLVPPTLNHPECPRYVTVSYTAAPLEGSASAETSATVRRMHPLSFCHVGFGSKALQPLPAPAQTVSLRRVLLVLRVRVVPPTPVTYCDDAGYCTP